MTALNRQYRGVDRTTDVLSFPQIAGNLLHPESGIQDVPLGDIVINLHKAKRQAMENGLSLSEELKRLLVHGLLHLVGYDHEKSPYQRRKMEDKEIELMGRL